MISVKMRFVFRASYQIEESTRLRFIDLFAGLGGFNLALTDLGHQCVFASESDQDLRTLYALNFGLQADGDLRLIDEAEIPTHDILCAGFPCQPFSKAGEQLGTKCHLWGDLFSAHVLRIIRHHQPTFLLMENVANLERHNGGRTWTRMHAQLRNCGYEVATRVLSPHKFGVPQIRERLFVVGSRVGLHGFNWPDESAIQPSIESVLDPNPTNAKALSRQVTRCLEVWQEFLERSPKDEELPSFPIWTPEFGATYPFREYESLYDIPLSTLRTYRGSFGQTLNRHYRKEILERLPSYARYEHNSFPHWKQLFIWQNREFYQRNKKWIAPWLPKIREFPPSWQKFEWNCKGEVRDLWRYVIQFRASGVRVKRTNTAPSLVAMTTTQVPIIAWQRRYMTPRECSRLQSMEALTHLPTSHATVYKALGNAVNVSVVCKIAERLLAVNFTKTKSRVSRAAATASRRPAVANRT